MIELLAVLVIVGILAATVAPRIRQRSGFSLEGAAAMVAADVRYAQELAMFSHTATSVVFPGGSSYIVGGRSVDLPSGVSTTSITYIFNPLGEPSAGGGGTVTLMAGGDTRTLAVANFTGRVAVQ